MNIAGFKTRLQDRKRELSRRLLRIEEELATANPDDEDRAVEREDEEVLESMGEQGLAELRAIEAALDRIESSRFGQCAKCGEPISTQRLEAVPHAALCMECMSGND